MDKEYIFKLTAGKELDALIAEKIFDWRWVTGILAFDHPCIISPERYKDKLDYIKDTNNHGNYIGQFLQYSTDMSNAWEIVLNLADRGYAPNLIYDDNGHWALSLSGYQDVAPCTGVTAWIYYQELWCDTAPLAICKASLLNILKLDFE